MATARRSYQRETASSTGTSSKRTSVGGPTIVIEYLLLMCPMLTGKQFPSLCHTCGWLIEFAGEVMMRTAALAFAILSSSYMQQSARVELKNTSNVLLAAALFAFECETTKFAASDAQSLVRSDSCTYSPLVWTLAMFVRGGTISKTENGGTGLADLVAMVEMSCYLMLGDDEKG